MALFKPGQPKTAGRRKGSRDRIATALLTALADDFEKFGVQAVKIARVEKPTEYLKVIASLLPRELEIFNDNRLAELTDDELDEFISVAKGQLSSRAASTGDGSGETSH